jgi:hypothetical protein
MTLSTVVGVVATEVGHVEHVELVSDHRGRLTARHVHVAIPAANYRRTQSESVPIDIEHERIVGGVDYLGFDRRERLWAAGTVRLSDRDRYRVWWFSPATSSTVDDELAERHEVELVRLALTRDPASKGLPPVRVLDGELLDEGAVEWWDRRHRLEPVEKNMLVRAVRSAESRRFTRSALVVDIQMPPAPVSTPRFGEPRMLHRGGGHVIGVR